MRDIKRIHRICSKIEKLWMCYPDQRFGQLISNYIPLDFYIEDEKESGMSKDTKYIEKYIDDKIAECELFARVRNETSYCDDVDKYWVKGRAGMKKYPFQGDTPLKVLKERDKSEPKRPDGKNYIKFLKNNV